MRIVAPSDGSLVAQPDQKEVTQQGRRRQSRQVYRIGAPGLTTARQRLAAAENVNEKHYHVSGKVVKW